MHHFNTRAYLDNLTAATTQEYSYTRALHSGDWKTWQRQWRARLEQLLGLPHVRAVAAHAPMEARSTQLEEFEDYSREKLFIATEPGIEVPCYLLLPKERREALPLVLTPHGHGRLGKETYVGNYSGEEDKAEAVEGERDIALQAVAEGYAVIAPDVRAFNEMSRAEDFPQSNNSCAELQRMALMYGRTLIGERVHDMGRLIDYAATRPEIDTSRIAITGNSGGGTVSLFTAAIDSRITVAVPGSYFCTFFGSVVSLHHCPCNIVPGILQSGEMYDVAGLIAPRPSLFVNGKEDPIFPIEHTRAAFAHVQEIYKSMGQTEKCELYEGDGGHRYYKERVWSFVSAAFDGTQ